MSKYAPKWTSSYNDHLCSTESPLITASENHHSVSRPPAQFFWFLLQHPVPSVFCLLLCLFCSRAPLLPMIWWFCPQHWSRHADIRECDTGTVLSRALLDLLVLTFHFGASWMDVGWLKLFELFIKKFRFMFTCFIQLWLLFMNTLIQFLKALTLQKLALQPYYDQTLWAASSAGFVFSTLAESNIVAHPVIQIIKVFSVHHYRLQSEKLYNVHFKYLFAYIQ